MKSESPPATVNMMWVGANLGPIEQLSLISFIQAGHPAVLHAYDRVANVPEGVEVANGNAIVPRDVIETLRYKKTGSYALASNYFRFCLFTKNAGLWADIDMICLKAIAPDTHIFGWESDKYINSAILSLPANSPVVADMIDVFAPNVAPPWMLWRYRAYWGLRARLGHTFTIADLPHAISGPKGLTALVARHNLGHLAAPPPVYYPLHPRLAQTIFEPDRSLDEFVRAETRTIHLWNEKLGPRKAERPPAGSILGALRRRFGV
jgi:hypothetical protein